MVTNIFRAVIDHECLTEALTPLQEIGIHILKQPYHSHWSFTPAHKQQISGLIGLEKSEGQQTYVRMLSEADTDCFSNRKTGMARRRVQYGVVNASDADVGAGAPGFRATWQSKDDLRQQVLSISDVPNNGKLYFWDGQLWLRWDDPDDLPGPEGDPLRIKIVCPEDTGQQELQHLLRTPLPPLNASESMKTKSQLDTPLPYHPATVEDWPDFSNRVASHIASLESSSQTYSPIVLPVTKMSSRESAVVFTWHSVVTETMNRILKQDGSDLQWQPDHSDLPTDSTDAQRLARSQVESAHATFVRQQFLDVGLHRLVSTEHKPLAVIEHKRRSRLHELFASSLDIVQIWNLKQECTTAMQGNVLGGISQVTRYAAAYGIKYVALSNYEGTIFGMFHAPHQLLLSNLIRFNDRAPSILECIHAITVWASSEDMHQPWKPCNEHAPSEKAIPDDTSDDSDHGASQNKKEAGSVAGKQGKRKRGAAADSSSAGGRLPRGKKASLPLSRIFRISTIVPLLQQQWQEQREGQHMLPDLGASAAAFCLGDICGVVGKGSSGRVFAARVQPGILAAVKLARVGTAEAHMLQREAKAYQHCKQLQYQVVPGVLAAGPAMDGTAYLLATCLLPVVGFSDCSTAKYQAVHAVKALHGLRLLHGDIRESNILCISEAKQSCKVILIDLGQSRLCTQESAFQQELLQTQQLFA
ncbi:TPA: hypothetical protein ACH3X2_000350 [Trebouxia sp. C0005]